MPTRKSLFCRLGVIGSNTCPIGHGQPAPASEHRQMRRRPLERASKVNSSIPRWFSQFTSTSQMRRRCPPAPGRRWWGIAPKRRREGPKRGEKKGFDKPSIFGCLVLFSGPTDPRCAPSDFAFPRSSDRLCTTAHNPPKDPVQRVCEPAGGPAGTAWRYEATCLPVDLTYG